MLKLKRACHMFIFWTDLTHSANEMIFLPTIDS
jgi:hypothetical protein